MQRCMPVQLTRHTPTVPAERTSVKVLQQLRLRSSDRGLLKLLAADACADNPCAGMPLSDGTCSLTPAPSSGFSCGCTTGAAWTGSTCRGRVIAYQKRQRYTCWRNTCTSDGVVLLALFPPPLLSAAFMGRLNGDMMLMIAEVDHLVASAPFALQKSWQHYSVACTCLQGAAL